MSSVNTSDTITFDTILEQGRKHGYVRRADLEAAIRHQAAAQPSADFDEQRDDEAKPESGPLDLDSAIDQLLAEDVDIIEDDEEARVQEDEAIESSIKAMETDSTPVADMPDESDAGAARCRPVALPGAAAAAPSPPRDQLRRGPVSPLPCQRRR